MARIQIDDVLIETREATVLQGGRSPRLAALGRRLPFPASLLWVSGGLIWALGTGILVRGVLALYDGTNLGQLDLGFLLTGLPLASLGATLAGLGILQRASAHTTDPASQLIEGPVDESRLEKNRHLLTSALSKANPQASVESLAADHGLPVEEVVWTLGVLCDRSEVSEELNLETGEWYYTLRQTPPEESNEIPDAVAESRPLTLEERLKKKQGEEG